MSLISSAMTRIPQRLPAANKQNLQRDPGRIGPDQFLMCLIREAFIGRLPLMGADRVGLIRNSFVVFHKSPRWESLNMGRTISYGDGFSQPPDRQPESTTGNQSQQRTIPECNGPLKEPIFVDMAIIKMCRDELDAVNLCIDLSRMSDEALCGYLGIDKGHWSRIRKGRAHFPTRKRLELMYLAGNWAPLQYELWKSRLLDRLKTHLNQKPDDGFAAFAEAA